jgi:ribonuclease-3
VIRRTFSGIYLGYFSSNRNLFKSIRHITGFNPVNINCYIQALRHHSASTTIHHNGSKDSNERLEYLGDSVLNTVVAELLFKRYPYKGEGFLTEMRSKIVSRESLNELAMKIGINHMVIYDRKAINPNNKLSIFGNALEAFIGAVFLDGGFGVAQKFIRGRLLPHIDIDKLQHTETNFKGRLIEWSQRNSKNVEFENAEILDHKQKIYKVRVLINRVLMGEAENLSKKKAEQLASQKAWNGLTSEITE